jgi:hypothetical protein
MSAVVGHQLAAVVLGRTTATRGDRLSRCSLPRCRCLLFTLVNPQWLMFVAMAAFGISAGTALTTAFTAADRWSRFTLIGVGFSFLTGWAHRLRHQPRLERTALRPSIKRGLSHRRAGC